MNQAIDRFKKEKLIPDKNGNGLKRHPKFKYRETQAVLLFVNIHTSDTSKYIDLHLQPVVKQIPSYIKHTNDFINKINDIGNIPPNIYLVKMDVKSLYTNKVGSEGITAV